MDLKSIAQGSWPDVAEFAAMDPPEREMVIETFLYNAQLCQISKPETSRHLAIVSLQLLDADIGHRDRHDNWRMIIMFLLGVASMNLEEPENAMQYFQEVLGGPSGEEYADLRRMAAANSATLLMNSDPDYAERLLRDSLAEAQALGMSISSISVNLGSLLRRRDETDAAIAVYNDAIDRTPDDDPDETSSLAALHGNLGNALHDAERYSETVPHFTASVTLFRRAGEAGKAVRRLYDLVEALVRTGSPDALSHLQGVDEAIFDGDLEPLHLFLTVCAPLLPATGEHQDWDAFFAALLDRVDVPHETAMLLTAARILLLDAHGGHREAAILALSSGLEAAALFGSPLRPALESVLAGLSRRFKTTAFLWVAPKEPLLSTFEAVADAQRHYIAAAAELRLMEAAIAGDDPGPEPPLLLGVGLAEREPPAWMGITDPLVLERYARFRDRWPTEQQLRATVQAGGADHVEQRLRLASAELLGFPSDRAAARIGLTAAIAKRPDTTPEERLREITELLGEVRSFAWRFPELLVQADLALATYTKEIPAGAERERIAEAIRLSRAAFATAEQAGLVGQIPNLAITLGNALTEYKVRFEPARFEEAKTVLRRGLEALEAVPPEPESERDFFEGTLLNSLGVAYVATGSYDSTDDRSVDDLHESARLLHAAYAIRRRSGELERRLRTAANLLSALTRLTNRADEDHSAEIAALIADITTAADETEPGEALAQALLAVADALADSGAPAAGDVALRAAAMLRTQDNGRLLILGLHKAGLVLWHLGDRDRAITLVSEAQAAIDPFAARASGPIERKRIMRGFAYVARLLEQIRAAPDDPAPAAPGSPRKAVEAWLIRANQPGGLKTILQAEATAAADVLAASSDEPIALFTLGWFSWLRYRALAGPDRTQERQTALDRLLPAFVRGVRPSLFPPPLLPELAACAIPYALEALKIVTDNFDEDLARYTVYLWENIVRAVPERHAGRPEVLLHLGAALQSRFRGTGHLADLDAAIDATEEAIRADDPPQYAALNLSVLLQRRYDAFGDPADIDRAIDSVRGNLPATNEALLAAYLIQLGSALRARYDENENAADLDEAISVIERAIDLGHASPSALSNLSMLLSSRFDRDEDPADLQQAVNLMRDSLSNTSATSPARSGRLAGLSQCLSQRYHRARDHADIDEAIELLREAVTTAPYRLMRGGALIGLVQALLIRYDTCDDPADLDEATEAARRSVTDVVDAPAGHHLHTVAQMNLASALSRRGHEDASGEAIEAYERALASPEKMRPLAAARVRQHIAMLLYERSKSSGSSADLDAAIDALRAAVDMAPYGRPEPARWNATLSVWLLKRAVASGSDADLDEAIALTRGALTLEPDHEFDQPMAQANLAAALVTRADRSGNTLDLLEARAMAQAAVDTRPSDPRLWSNYLFTFHHSYEATEDVALIETAYAAATEAVSTVDRTSPNFASMLANISAVARMSLDYAASARTMAVIALIEDAYPLDEADRTTSVADAATEADRVAALAGRPGAIQLRSELGYLWLTHGLTRAQEGGMNKGIEAVDRALSLFRTCLLAGGHPVDPRAAASAAKLALPIAEEVFQQATRGRLPEQIKALPSMCLRLLDALPEDDEDRPGVLAALSGARLTQFLTCGGEPSLIDDALTDLRAAASSLPQQDRGDLLQMLSNLYRTSFEQTGRIDSLTVGIEVVGEALALVPSDAVQALLQHTLRRLLLARHYATGSFADLDSARQAAERAVQLSSTDDYFYQARLSGIAETLRADAAYTGDVDKLDEAIRLVAVAANAYADGWQRVIQILELTHCLTARYEAGGPPLLLDTAAENTRYALGLEAEHIEDSVRLRAALSVVLRLRHERFGAAADLDEAISLARAVLAETRPDHHARDLRLSDLAEALLLRFRREGASADLDEAVEAAGAAATLTSRATRAVLLSRSAGARLARFDVTGDRSDLDAAITDYREAADATRPGSPGRSSRLAELALALHRRGKHIGDISDLTEATGLLAALPATGDAHRLAGVLRTRHALTGDPADLDAAVAAARPTGDPADPLRAGQLRELAELLGVRGEPADQRERVQALTEAAGIAAAPPSVRVAAAREAAGLLAENDPGRAANLLQAAVRLLPEIAPRYLRRTDQQRELTVVDGLATEAAELLLAAAAPGDPEAAQRALDLLEAGRSVLLNQALELDGDLTALRADYPELAARYERLRVALGQPGADVALRRDAADFAMVLREIRAQDGYASFPRAGSSEGLLEAAAAGAVVTFVVGRARGYALLLTSSGITARELPGLTREVLAERAAAFHAALRIAPSDAAGHLERVQAQQAVSETLVWLWESVARPVLDALGHPARPQTAAGALPRVWWAPGGLLGSLPLHAAGDASDSVLDRVVSSYTATINALQNARRPAAETTTSGQRALIIAMPTTPGAHRPLDHVPDEVAALRAHFLMPTVLTEPGPSTQDRLSGAAPLPTGANVLARLTGCPIVHFACHGYTDAEDPSRSGLLLHDHATAPFTVARLAPLHLESAQLAYLSACQTAVTRSAALADEAIHLASAFQLAGYRHVIGTLWEVSDHAAVNMADDFYRALAAAAGLFNTAGAAVALHHAIQRARKRSPNFPWLWAAYMHTGA